MNEHADNTQENKSKAVANSFYKTPGAGESAFQFIDNRPETVEQRKLQAMANSRPKTEPLKASPNTTSYSNVPLQREKEGNIEMKPDVAQIAEDGAKEKPPQLYKNLSAKMCWDAVLYCGYLAKLTDREANGENIIDKSATPVSDSSGIPRGHIIGFFGANDVLKHVMLSTGNGLAAGNKNQCMGFGAPVGWEVLDLPDVSDEGVFMLGGVIKITMRHKAF